MTNLKTFSIICLLVLGLCFPTTAKNQTFFPDPGKKIEVYNVNSLNSKGLDFCAIPYREGIIFTSSRSQVNGKGVRNILNKNYFDLFYSKKNKGGNYLEPKKLKGNINGKLHDGTASFNQSGDVMFFTRNNQQTKGLIALKIYSASIVEGQWINVNELPFNSTRFSNCHPSLSKDETRLYFASDRPGGFGGMDIYVTNYKNGRWSEPENLGANVNTPGNELFPFIDSHDNLYFSSDGEGGQGKLDIYKCEKDGKRFKRKYNLGENFNSSSDDFGFFINESETEGFFSSNREGGLGSDDIYGWKYKEEPKETFRNFTVIDNNSGELLDEVDFVVEFEDEMWEQSKLNSIEKGTYVYPVKKSDSYLVKVVKTGFEDFTILMDEEELLEKENHTILLKKRRFSLLNGTVQGQVYKEALARVSIEIMNECDGRKQTAKTDKEGNFGFTVMCGCDYVVIAKKEKYLAATKIIRKEENPCENSQLIKAVLTLRNAPNSNFPRASVFD